jgi:hypothetical protein
MLAVIVTGVAVETCPACIWNCSHPVLAGMVTVAGTGAAAGFELARLIVAPAGPTAAVSCSQTHVVSPLLSGFFAKLTDTGVGGAELIVKLLTVDHAVRAAVVGEESP